MSAATETSSNSSDNNEEENEEKEETNEQEENEEEENEENMEFDILIDEEVGDQDPVAVPIKNDSEEEYETRIVRTPVKKRKSSKSGGNSNRKRTSNSNKEEIIKNIQAWNLIQELSHLINECVLETDRMKAEPIQQKAQNHLHKIQENLEDLVTIKQKLNKFVDQNPKIFGMSV